MEAVLTPPESPQLKVEEGVIADKPVEQVSSIGFDTESMPFSHKQSLHVIEILR
jgi:hypothetical protein